MAVAEISAVSILNKWSVTENVPGDPYTGKTVSPTTFNQAQSSYSQTSTPKALHYAAKTVALVAGALTIDLTALAGWGLQDTIDGTGLKILAMRVRGCAAGNAALIISEGAANPMELFGAGNPIVYPATLTKPWLFEFGETLDDISDTDCEIDLVGTGTEQFEFEFLLGSQA